MTKHELVITTTKEIIIKTLDDAGALNKKADEKSAEKIGQAFDVLAKSISKTYDSLGGQKGGVGIVT